MLAAKIFRQQINSCNRKNVCIMYVINYNGIVLIKKLYDLLLPKRVLLRIIFETLIIQHSCNHYLIKDHHSAITKIIKVKVYVLDLYRGKLCYCHCLLNILI